MVRSRARSVTEYLADLPPDRRRALSRIRELVRARLPQFREGIEYGMPYYRGPDGKALGFASQARYVAVYVGDRAAERAKEAGLDVGRSCIRLPSPDSIDWPLIEELVGLAGG